MRAHCEDHTGFSSKDYHPHDHCSFNITGGPFPPHCVQGSMGSGLAQLFSAWYVPCSVLPFILRLLSSANRTALEVKQWSKDGIIRIKNLRIWESGRLRSQADSGNEAER